MDVRPGGLWSFVQRHSRGKKNAFHGVYHEISPPEGLVQTSEFQVMPGHVLLEIIRFVEIDGKTKLTDKSVFQTVEDRDGMLKVGMEAGITETTDRLTELLEEQKPL